MNAQSAALLAIIIPTQILLFVARGPVGNTEQATLLAWIITGASVISLLLPPLIGSLSDHTPGALGRRRPYIIIGGVLIVLSTPFLVISENVFIFLAGLALLLVGRNILTPAYSVKFLISQRQLPSPDMPLFPYPLPKTSPSHQQDVLYPGNSPTQWYIPQIAKVASTGFGPGGA